ncbi:fibrinogen-like protein 1 [Cherax quadricarinatus]|uniref:fibrinogen-like protein 1 n=1 Tax=Cherax quadricarinatus TaxID=27406 RepID=UPI00387E3C0A
MEEEERSAEWRTFSVSDESCRYRVTAKEYVQTSSLGDCITSGSWGTMNGMYFSTKDRDNDDWSGNCAAEIRNGGGWWFARCGVASPTSPHVTTSVSYHEVLSWQSFHPGVWVVTPLSKLEMMVRRDVTIPHH